MPLFFLGTREWRNRQTRTVQVRVPVMEWGFNSPLAHDETADPLWICGFCFPWLWLRCCRSCFLGLQDTTCCCVFGPCLISGCCVGTGVRFPPSPQRDPACRVVLLWPRGQPGGRAPEGPAAVCAGVRRSSCLLFVAPTDLRPPRGLPARSPSALRASLGASSRSPARPRRPRGGLQSVGVSVCCPAGPRHRPRAPQPGPLHPAGLASSGHFPYS